MQTVFAFRASAMPPEELGRTLADYLALDRARIIRRAMVARFGAVAAIGGPILTVGHLLSPMARVIAVALCLVPPFGAWVTEIGLEQRLVRRMDQLDTAGTQRNTRSTPTGIKKS